MQGFFVVYFEQNLDNMQGFFETLYLILVSYSEITYEGTSFN